jgi:outer membrane protein assembly factor BamB
VRWRLETDGEVDTAFVELPDGAVVVAAGRDVLALRRGGDVAWRFTAKGKVFTAPAVTPDGLVIVGSQDHHAYGIDARTGARVFATDLGSDVDGAAAIGDDGAVFVGTDGGDVVRLDAHGAIMWRAAVGGFVRGVLSVGRSGDVLAGVYGPTPRQVRVSASGEVRGGFGVPGTGAREFGVHGGALEDLDGALFFGAQDDTLYAFDPGGGPRFRFAAKGDIDAPLTLLSDGHLVFATDEGTVYDLAPRPD